MMTMGVFAVQGLVFFPSTTLPLNVFEPRYLSLIEDSLRDSKPILLSPKKPAPGDIAGFGEPKLLHRREDGTLLIAVMGRGKARVLSVDDSKAYQQVECEPIEVNSRIEVASLSLYSQMRTDFESWIKTQVEEPAQLQWVQEMLSQPQAVLDHMITYRVQDQEHKQGLMNLSDINEQLSYLATLPDLSSPSQVH
jgi:Lon protease-like protein